MATPAKKLHNLDLVKHDEEQSTASNPAPRPIALTPTRRRELIRETVEEYRETLDILARYDREHAAEDSTN